MNKEKKEKILELLAVADAEFGRMEELLAKHGICLDCGELFSHDIIEPFAHCGCHTTEWTVEFTPYMKLEEKIMLGKNND